MLKSKTIRTTEGSTKFQPLLLQERKLNTTLRVILEEFMYGQNIVRDSLGNITLTDFWRLNGGEQNQRQRDRLKGSCSNLDYCLWLSSWFLKAGLLNVAIFF